MVQYSQIVEAVKNNQLKINMWGGATGIARIFNVDGISFDAEQRPCTPSFVLKWDKFSLSLSHAMPGILKAKGLEVQTTMFKSKYIIKSNKPIIDHLYVDDDILSISHGANRITMADIDFGALFTTMSWDEYMSLTIKSLELGAEKKVIDYFSKSATAEPLNIPGMNDESLAYLKSIGLSNNGFNPKIEYNNGPQKSPIKVSIKSFSSLPSISSVVAKLDKNRPLTPSESLIHTYLSKYNTATPESLNEASESVKEELERTKDATRATNYSVLYRGYNFGHNNGTAVEGDFNNYHITFEVDNTVE